MKKQLIVLYGPPGVGKLTVSKELSKITGLETFHVHQVADLISSLFDTGTKEFAESFESVWFSLLEKLLDVNKEGVITTLIYGVQTLEGKKDDVFFSKVIATAENKNAEVFFVKLECSDEKLKERVASKGRESYKKLTDYKKVEEIRKKYKVDRKIPFTESIVIDTTNLTPSEAALEIKKHCFH